MNKSVTCPVCNGKAIRSFNDIFVDNSFITCKSCGAALNHSFLAIVLFALTALLLFFVSIYVFRDINKELMLTSCIGVFILWLYSMYAFLPLKKVVQS